MGKYIERCGDEKKERHTLRAKKGIEEQEKKKTEKWRKISDMKRKYRKGQSFKRTPNKRVRENNTFSILSNRNAENDWKKNRMTQ